MQVAVFSTKAYDRRFLDAANEGHGHRLTYHEARLGAATAVLARGAEAVCVFVNDIVDRSTLEAIAEGGTRLVALRCAGFNNVHLQATAELGIHVVRVPAYSPHAVAEHTVALVLALNRKIHKAYARVREGNFALDGLLGFDLLGRTVGIVGTGRIGALVCRILYGFGCRVLASDPYPDADLAALGVTYARVEELFATSDIVSLHCPLTPETHHLVDAAMLARVTRPGFKLVNTSRGALLDTRAAIDGLKQGRIGGLALDVYEEEADLFFENLSEQVIQDDVFARLLTFPNVLITAHQAFFTEDALRAIAETTIANLTAFANGARLDNEVTVAKKVSDTFSRKGV